MTKSPFRYFSSLSAILLIAVLCVASAANAQIPEGRNISSIPSLKDTDGSVFNTEDLNGRFSLIAFFSVYSDNSSELLKYLDKIQNRPEYADHIQVLGVNLDPSPDAVRYFLKENNISTRILIDDNLELSNRFAVKKPPNIFLTGPDRKILISSSGFSLESQMALELQISEMIESKGTGAEKNADNQTSERDEQFREKKLVSAGANMIKLCPARSDYMLYVSSDNILWLFNINDLSRKEIATDVATADWAPECNSVVFDTRKKSGVWIKPLEKSAEQIATIGKQPAWSPAGDMISFIVDTEVWVYSRSSGKKWQTPFAGKKAQWTLDGSLMVLTDQKGRVWLASPNSQASWIKRILK